MAKNTGIVGEFCQSGKVGTLVQPSPWSRALQCVAMTFKQ